MEIFQLLKNFKKSKISNPNTLKFLNIEFSNDWNFSIFDFEILHILVYEISKMSKFIL